MIWMTNYEEYPSDNDAVHRIMKKRCERLIALFCSCMLIWQIYLESKIGVAGSYGTIVQQPLNIVHNYAGHHRPKKKENFVELFLWANISILGDIFHFQFVTEQKGRLALWWKQKENCNQYCLVYLMPCGFKTLFFSQFSLFGINFDFLWTEILCKVGICCI